MHQPVHGAIADGGYKAAISTPVTRFLVFLSICAAAWGQDASRVAPDPAQANSAPKRIFWVIPNHRTTPEGGPYHPLTTGQKFKIAQQETLDPGTFLLAGALAGIGQWSNDNPSFGQGAAGYARRYGTSYGDLAIGDYLTTAIYPSLLHQDPRYFRRGIGSTWSRLGYAMGQTLVTHGDNRRTQFNYSEVVGNATAVAISNAYNPDNRTATDAVGKLGIQLGVDMAGNILKEFTPDLYRKFGSKKHTTVNPALPAVK